MCKTPEQIITSGPELDPLCNGQTVVKQQVSQAAQSWADDVSRWIGDMIATSLKALTTAWIHIGLPAVTRGDPSGNVPSEVVSFLQSSLMYVTGAFLVANLIIAAIKMMITNQGKPGIDAFHDLLRFVIVLFMGTGIIGMLAVASHSLAVYILDSATAGEDLGTAIGKQISDSGGMAFLMYVFLGLIGAIVTLLQILILLGCGGILIALTGVLPWLATFPGEQGRASLQKGIAWTGAVIAYPTAGAIVYATSFKLMAENDYASIDDTKTIEHLAGISLLILAILTLPALFKIIMPITAAMGSGRGAGAMLAGAAAMILPTGVAAMAGRSAGAAAAGGGGGGGGGGGSGSNPGPTGASGGSSNGGTPAMAGAPSPGGSSSSNGSTGRGGNSSDPFYSPNDPRNNP